MLHIVKIINEYTLSTNKGSHDKTTGNEFIKRQAELY